MPETVPDDNITILIIDDNADDRKMISRYLQKIGYAFIEAENAEEGIRRAASEEVTCIMVDNQMPFLSGIDFVKKIKKDPKLKFIPVIILTGMEQENNIVEGLEAGADDYVGKSSSEKIIISRVKAAVRMRKVQEEVKQVNEKLRIANKELNTVNAAKSSILNQLNRAIQDLREMSIRDSLTKLYNHGYFREILEIEVKRSISYNRNVCCLMIDIDYFKKINDRYGHMIGDKVLAELSSCLISSTREVDFIARYGGEEFVVLLFNADYEGAYVVAERIRKNVESKEFNVNNINIKLTISVGLASFFEDDLIEDKDKFLGAADEALYRAKLKGRNNTVRYRDIVHSVYQESEEFKDLENKMVSLSEISRNSYLESVKTLIITLEERDLYTREHSLNVLRYSLMVAKEMGLPMNEIEIIGNAAILHDLGKIGISDKILLKREPLTEEEFEVIKKHPAIGVNMLQKSNFIRRELQLIYNHHERYDGKGYPEGLAGKMIPLGARIICVADSYDAMRAARPYRDALPIETVIDELVKNAGKQFDPVIVSAFLKALNKNSLIPEEIRIEDKLKLLQPAIDAAKAA